MILTGIKGIDRDQETWGKVLNILFIPSIPINLFLSFIPFYLCDSVNNFFDK